MIGRRLHRMIEKCFRICLMGLWYHCWCLVCKDGSHCHRRVCVRVPPIMPKMKSQTAQVRSKACYRAGKNPLISASFIRKNIVLASGTFQDRSPLRNPDDRKHPMSTTVRRSTGSVKEFYCCAPAVCMHILRHHYMLICLVRQSQGNRWSTSCCS